MSRGMDNKLLQQYVKNSQQFFFRWRCHIHTATYLKYRHYWDYISRNTDIFFEKHDEIKILVLEPFFDLKRIAGSIFHPYQPCQPSQILPAIVDKIQ